MIEDQNLNIKIQDMLLNYKSKNFDEAKKIALEMTKEFSNHNLSWKILSCIHTIKGQFNDAIETCQKAIEINSDDHEAYNNLSLVYFNLKKFNEALKFSQKAVKLKFDYAEVYLNIAIILIKLNRLEEADTNCRKAINFKENFTEAYAILGLILHKLNKVEEAKFNYYKALEIKPNHVSASRNLNVLNKQIALLNIVKKKSSISLDNSLFKFYRPIEDALIKNLYQINTKNLDDVDPEILRYGNGVSSDYNLFKTDNLIIKNLERDLTVLIEKKFKSKIYIMESFFNIFKKGSGIIKHNHVTKFDEQNELVKNKFSLVYYLSIGDQSGVDPGNLKLYDPEVEILPTDGMILIFPAQRFHKSSYSGKFDRVMVGVNFYTLD